jgi:flagellar basal body rod protein FlgB
MMIGDVTLDTIHAGLNGLNARREAAEDAVANSETPGYIARDVSFEGQLSRAIQAGDPLNVAPQTSYTTDEALPNGNNVRVEREIAGLTDTSLRQQLLVEAANAKFRLLRTVITGQ